MLWRRVLILWNFNPRPPRGGRRDRTFAFSIRYNISIHALREEGDVVADFGGDSFVLFQSTPSARRATITRHSHGARCSVFQSTPSARRAT